MVKAARQYLRGRLGCEQGSGGDYTLGRRSAMKCF